MPKSSDQSDEQFAELEVSIGYMVRNAHRAYDKVLDRRLKPYGILTGEYSMLRVLWHEDGLSQIEVARRMKVERASLTLMLTKLEKAGLIVRNIHPTDGRKQIIRLTPKGRALEKPLIAVGTAVNSLALDGFSERETNALRRLLRRAIAHLERKVE